MKFKRTIATILSLAMCTGACATLLAACNNKGGTNNTNRTVTETKLKVYEGPNLLDSSDRLKASVEDTELFVYDTRVNHNRIFSWAAPTTMGQVVSFDFEGKVHMKVEINDADKLTDVVVRPVSYGVETKVTGNVIEFDLEYSSNYTLEYLVDGESTTDAGDNALHIFANPLEENPIDPENVPDDVLYVGPGVYSAGAIPISSGKTIYLAGGAYVYGQVRAENLENITIRGRGIFSGSIFSRGSESEYTLPVELRFCKNVKIEGVSFLDPAGWAITLYKSENVEIDNVKIITARSNGDGISVQSCKDVTVTGGFVRTWDDSLVVKNSDRGTTSNITFDNVTVWTDLAQSCEVGYETYGATMDNITFRNITIIHNYHKAAMSIHNCDDATITNVTYQNITIEDAKMLGDNRIDGLNDFLIDITIAYSTEWTKSEGKRGKINGVKFDNIKVLNSEDTIISRINGENGDSYVENVKISGVEIEGVAIKNAADLGLVTNANTKNISVSGGKATGANVKLPYNLKLSTDAVQKTVIPGVVQQGLEVPDFAMMDVQETYMGIKLDVSDASVSTAHGKGTAATSAPDYSNSWGDASAAFDGNRTTAFTAKDWTGETDEFISVTVDFGKRVAPGVLRVYLAEDCQFVYNLKMSVFTKNAVLNEDGTPKLDEKGNEILADVDGTPKLNSKGETQKANFGRSVSNSTFGSTPATGNYFDIKLATKGCTSLQLRFFRVDGMMGQKKLEINDIAFYPSSLSTNKAVDATPHSDVYDAGKANDGIETTYWEAKTAEAYYSVDLGDVYNVKYIIMHLPPLMTWPEKHQEIEIQVSMNGTVWTTVAARKDYSFNPLTGNANSIELDVPVQARYVKLNFYSNDSGYGAQLSELYVYDVA